MKVLKKGLLAVLCLMLVALLVVGGYVLYIVLQYSRIEDNTPLAVQNPQVSVLPADAELTALTFNIGFGAYDHDFSFFMDKGVMLDGTEVVGKESRAASLEAAKINTDGVCAAAGNYAADFMLFQEVDTKSHRSYRVNQAAAIEAAFPDYGSVFASNFHSAFLFYPPTKPHGAVQSGLLTLSAYSIDEAVRRSFPVDGSFPTKFFDLDRCFEVMRLPVADTGKELVLINTHMSAYDKGGIIRAAQFEMLANVLTAERDNGNWVVVGGDFNHALNGTETAFDSQQQQPEWLAVFDESILPQGFRQVAATNVAEVATCRATDLPYEKGMNYEVVLDGFIVSDNVEATAENIDLDFENSDHNPVRLTFRLK